MTLSTPCDGSPSAMPQSAPVLPVTKVPALNVIDQYVVGPVSRSHSHSETIEVPCCHDSDIIQGYASFVARFTGLEEVMFVVNHSKSPDLVEKTIVHAVQVSSLDGSIYQWQELHNLSFKKEETQFVLDFGMSVPGNEAQVTNSHPEDAFTLHVRPTATLDQLQVNISYPQRLIPSFAVPHLLRTLSFYLTSSSPDVATPMPEPSILNFPSLATPPSRDRLATDYHGSHLLHGAFERWVLKTPNAPALDFVSSLATSTRPAQHHTLSYGALDAAATNLAIFLQQLVSHGHATRWPSSFIPVYMSTSPELYISYLAILKAGYAFVPIPLDASQHRTREIIRDLESPVILGIGEEPLSGAWYLEETKPTWINVTEVSRWQDFSDQSGTPTQDALMDFNPPAIQDDQTAYLLFTSGSTGKPKGVQVSHLAVTCSIESHSTAIPLPDFTSQKFRWFQFAAPTFDPSLMEIFVTLSSGGTLCSASRDLTLTDLETSINETRATIMMATPSLAALIRPSKLTTLKSLWTMGEKLNRTVISNFGHQRGSPDHGRTLVNAYGPTEGAINCTFMAPIEYSVRGSIIGKPLPTCSIFVLDPGCQVPKIVPAGCAGELAIGGPQLSKGYLNRPMETKKAFVTSLEFGRLYRTGDMARVVWDESGRQLIEFLGRITSDQVKVSGRRLELGEIESALAAVDDVTEVVAVVSKRNSDRQGSEQIVACLVSKDTSSIARDIVVQNCQQNAELHLTSYMYPSAYMFLEALPKSSSGKVDRKAIAAILQSEAKVPDLHIPRQVSIYQESSAWDWSANSGQVTLEKLVVQALHDTLEEDPSTILPETNLYTLGLDSLGAMRLLQKLRDSSIYGLEVGDILRAQTPIALVLRIASLAHAQDSNHGPSDHTRSRSQRLEQRLHLFSERNRQVCADRLRVSGVCVQSVLPTTATQSGMLASFLRTSTENTDSMRSYIYHSVMPLGNMVDLNRLKNAWKTVIDRYDSFRTVFCWLDDDMSPFAQCILDCSPSSARDWSFYTSNPEPAHKQATVQLAIHNAEQSINLDRAPWWISLVTSGEEVTLILSMFHAIFDGGSLQLLLEDVNAVYNSEGLPPRTSLEHVVKHHFLADQEATEKFWDNQLEGKSPVAFPSLTATQPPSAPTTHAVEITAGVGYDELKRESKRMGVTPLSVLQAAWGSILLAYSGSQDHDVVMGSVVSGRLDVESENCIGPTFTTVPIRIALDKIPKVGDSWTNSSVAQYLTALNAETLSFLQPRLGSPVTAEGRLPYDTLLAYQDFSAGSNSSNLWTSIYHPPMINDFAVMIEIWPDAKSSLVLRASFSDTCMDQSAATMMLRQLSSIVSFILKSPGDDYLDAACVVDNQFKSVFDSVPSQPQDDAQTSLIHSGFEKHAVSNPDDLAFVFQADLDDESNPANIAWSYQELDAKSQSLANFLLSTYGPLTNSPIPIRIEKSPALYVAILGILKAGGAWCPIDTFSPPQRRHDLVKRCSAKVVLISSADSLKTGVNMPEDVAVIDVLPFTTASPPTNALVGMTTKTSNSCPKDMAYLIWTSGTTGAPKGVPITHSSGVASMNSLLKRIPMDAQEGPVRCLQFSQYTFDVSIQDIFYTWSCGGVLISAPREIMLGSFARLSNITNASHAHLTPAFAASVQRATCMTLKVVTMIGEKLPQPVADDWGTGMRAFNTYGPAEATIVSTVREFGKEQSNVKSANIGWPLDTVSVFVTRNQRMLMKNAVGELALGGPQLSPGYFNQEDVTKAKYAWNDETSQILYHTGDLVRMLSDGSLEYINRVDDLVKLGGIRVELSEISYSLGNCHPLVEGVETLLLSRSDRPNEMLVSFLSAPSAAVDHEDNQILLLNKTAIEIVQDARDRAHKSLPAHMIPSVYIVLQRIPRTQSAKTDRRELQRIYADLNIDSWDNTLTLSNGHDVPLKADLGDSSLSREIVGVISSLANISEDLIMGPSRLGSLGIDSIRAIRLASRLNSYGHRLSVIDVLQCTRVQDLINLATSGSENAEPSHGFDMIHFDRTWHPAAAVAVQDDFFVCRATPIQESLLSETMGSMEMYWSNHFSSLGPEVDTSRLKQAWLAVCQKNESLRVGFLPLAGIVEETGDSESFALVQLIYDHHQLDWQHIECTGSTYRSALEERVETIMSTHQENYFRHPPWAVTIFEVEGVKKMVFTVHHSIHDGPSLDFIMQDVCSAYLSKPPSRPQLQNALSIILPTDLRSDQTRQFWKAELANFVELDLPVWPDLTGKRIRPSSQKKREFISREVRLTEPISTLQAQANALGLSSIAAFVRVAWALVSTSYLGTPAAVFAETLSDRVLNSDIEKATGPFISVVPLPFHPRGSVREVLQEQQRLSTQSWKHRLVHAREVRKILNRPRGESLYPGVFTFHSTRDERADCASPLWSGIKDEIGLNVEHPMAMNVFRDSNDQVILEASSQATVMSPGQLEVFVRQVDGLVSAMSTHPDALITDLSGFLSPKLLSRTTPDISENVRDSVLLSPTHWFEVHAERNPEWTAVEVASSITDEGVEKECMDYGTLNAAANRVASYLVSRGFQNRSIAICAGRNLPSYPVTLGIFKSGNAYLPIDEGLPDDRKTFLIEDGSCPVVFTESSFAGAFATVKEICQVICFDQDAFQQELLEMSPANSTYPASPDNNAYILYTSGSTGKPKGVMVTRANLASFMESLSEFLCKIAPATLKLGGKGRWLAQASRAFDPHLAEMFFPWQHGMATVTGQRTMLMDDLQMTLARWDITHASFVPSLLDQANILPHHCPELKYLSVGGEKISQRVLDTWGAAPGVGLTNAYGPTEATIGCTFAHVNENTTLRNIGAPLSSCVCHVLHLDSLSYALRGQTGELCFTGDIVAKGYLNRPDAKGFVIGPDGQKMYRTGDIGRLLIDDTIEYLGRGDDQTKIRGQRLELGEVSEVLRSSSQIAIDVVTMIAKHPSLPRNQLISFVARSDTRLRDEDLEVTFILSDIVMLGKDLQDACKTKLPGYMVPEIVLPITQIPLAPMSGKANVKQLQNLFAGLPLSTVLSGNNPSVKDCLESETRHLNADEKAVVAEICKTVSVDPSLMKHQTNIFEIGVDSLSAINLSVRLRKIGYQASVALVMSCPVVEQLARLPRNSGPESALITDSELQRKLLDLNSRFDKSVPAGVDKSLLVSVRPCLPLQEGLIARTINNPDDLLYINHVALKLDPSTDLERLRMAWQATATESEILRTAFAPLELEVAQMVYEPSQHRIQWMEEQESFEDLQARRGHISRDIIQTITVNPPVRFRIARSEQSVLQISIHHSLYDGESFGMLLEDVAARYLDIVPGTRGSPAMFIQHVSSLRPDKSQLHWCRMLSGCYPTIFNSENHSLRHSEVVRRTSSMSLSEIERCSARLQTTVPSLIQTVFALILAEIVTSCDVTYGIVLSGRAVSVTGADSVLLPCITTIPGRLNTESLATAEDAIRSVQRATVKSLEYQHTSLRHIQRWINSEKPLFDCLFSFVKTTETPSHKIWEEIDSAMPSDYPLAVEVEADQMKDRIHIHCGFTSSFGPLARAHEFLEKMNLTLSTVVSGEPMPLEMFNFSKAAPLGSTNSVTKTWDNDLWTPLETAIRNLVADSCSLDVENISKGASFLSLGIDSVTAIQFSRRLRENGILVSSADVMRFSCVGALSDHLSQQASNAAPGADSIAKEPSDHEVVSYASRVALLSPEDSIQTVFECSPLQSAMITQTLGSAESVYVHPHIVKLSESTDTSILKTALDRVVHNNDILRTSFHSVPELGFAWVGAVHESFPVVWHEISLSSNCDMTAEIMKHLPLSEESAFAVPPIQPTLVHRPEGRFLAIIMHHALYDGVSLPFIFEDLVLSCQGAIPPSRPQFSNTVQYLLQGQKAAADFWAQKLVGYEITEIPPLSPQEACSSTFFAERPVALNINVIMGSCREVEVTVQSVALLAYAKVLSQLIGKRDVVFGQVLAGRSLPGKDSERTIGPLFNTIAQRITLDPKILSNREMVQRLQAFNSEAQDHQHAPLGMVQNLLRQNGGLEVASLFDTLFVFQKSAHTSGGLLEEQSIWRPWQAGDFAAGAEHKLNIEIDHADNAVIARASCKGEFLSQNGLLNLLKSFDEAFRDIVECPSRCVAAFPEQLGTLPLSIMPRVSETSSTMDSMSSPHESIMRSILADIAGVSKENILPGTSIFAIGLDSLSAIRIASVCRSKGLKTGVADILQGNTLRGICARIESTSRHEEAVHGSLVGDYEKDKKKICTLLGISPDAIERILPCLAGQNYHLASWLQSGRTLFEPAWSYSCSQRIDVNRLKESWFQLRQKHPILRTCFGAVEPAGAVQVVLKSADQDDDTFQKVESSESLTRTAQDQARQEALQPSSLRTPPVRLRLLKASDRDGIVLLINHAAYDAWSMPMFVSELAQNYRGETALANPDFPSFVEYTVKSLRSLDEAAYWNAALRDSIPTLLQPPRSGVTNELHENHQLFIGAWEKVKNLTQLEQVCRAAGVGLQTIVLLAFARVLGRITNLSSPTFGLYQVGRSAAFPDIERLSGPCLNVTPFTAHGVSSEDGRSILDKAQSIRTALADRVPYEQSSLRDILAHCGRSKQGVSPLFNVWVNLLWMQPGDLSSPPACEGNAVAELFEPLAIGVPTDFIPSTPFADSAATATSVSVLDTSFLSKGNIYIDIGPDVRTDSIGFGVRVEGGLMEETEAHALLASVGDEVEHLVSFLKS